MKGVTVLPQEQFDAIMVSIHTPNEGSDKRKNLQELCIPVSIHTPNEGSDAKDQAQKES